MAPALFILALTFDHNLVVDQARHADTRVEYQIVHCAGTKLEILEEGRLQICPTATACIGTLVESRCSPAPTVYVLVHTEVQCTLYYAKDDTACT